MKKKKRNEEEYKIYSNLDEGNEIKDLREKSIQRLC